MADEIIVMDADAMRRALARISHEIVERNHGAAELLLVGLQRRGVPLAHRIADAILEFEGLTVPVGALDISLYRDDLTSRPKIKVQPTTFPGRVDGMIIVLVDDVLFTGRSVRAALDALIDFGRPKQVELAVLVDRGHRELPIRPDYVGKNIPTSISDDVMVQITEVDPYERVVVLARETSIRL
jgi:pyrimidine operon attenuation protein/uracil phosphoribosyltransferase